MKLFLAILYFFASVLSISAVAHFVSDLVDLWYGFAVFLFSVINLIVSGIICVNEVGRKL